MQSGDSFRQSQLIDGVWMARAGMLASSCSELSVIDLPTSVDEATCATGTTGTRNSDSFAWDLLNGKAFGIYGPYAFQGSTL